MKLLIVYYSIYGHIYKMAQAEAEEASLKAIVMRVPETLSDKVVKKMGAAETQKQQSDIPLCEIEELADANAIIFGTPKRFGNMCGQMRQFLDSTGGLWSSGALAGKVGGVFTSSNTQHGGQESTILSFHITLLHHGMIISGLPYSFKKQMNDNEIIGRSLYGHQQYQAAMEAVFQAKTNCQAIGFKVSILQISQKNLPAHIKNS